MATPAIVPIFGLFIFIALMALNMWQMSKVAPTADNRDEVESAINTSMFSNGALILLLLFLSLFYVQANPSVERRYVFILLHANLFLSLLAVSVSVIVKRQ